MMRTSMSSLAFAETRTCSWKKKECFCPEASSSVPSCHFSIRKQAGDSCLQSEQPSHDNWLQTRHPDIEE